MAVLFGSLAVGAALAAVLGLILRKVIRDKKQGKSFCGGDCSACGGDCSACGGNCARCGGCGGAGPDRK